MTTAYADGVSSAPAGAPIRPTILNGYAVRPPWKVAGVDYAVGGSNVVLTGYDFSLGGGWEVIVQGANDTVRNSKFVVGPNQGSMGTVLNVTRSASNFSFLCNSVDGANVPVTAQLGTTISIAS